MSIVDQPRQPAGVPVGGQFATAARAEPDFGLRPEIRVPVTTAAGVEARIGAWTGNPRPNEPEVRQVLADLRAYTRSVGVSDDAFARLVAESTR